MLRFDGRNTPFKPRPWEQVQAEFREAAAREPRLRHVADIVDSVVRCGKTGELAVCTSMHDLVVARRPLSDPPLDVLHVSAPGSQNVLLPDEVRIDHLATTGHDERIHRPVADAVPLFWRFVLEKFGIASGWTPDRTTTP